MPLADVDICNLGLAYIGETQFMDAIGDDSTSGAIAKRVYDQTRDEVLRDFRWPFAKRIWKPAALLASTLKTTIVPDEWAYAFAYPADCVSLLGLYPGARNPREDQKIEHELHNDGNVGKIILADAATPVLIGTAQVTDTAQFAPDFVETVAWKLGFKFSTSIRKDAKSAQLAWNAYREALGRAAANASQEIKLQTPVPAHIAARR